jgi:formamidopyrimidine-DNA glycosylase
MPELPEVETTLRAITPYLVGRRITAVIVRNRQLRWPVPAGINRLLAGHVITNIERRAKYLLFELEPGWLILHLGMSGSLRIVRDAAQPEQHDHVDFVFGPALTLRFRDPRRFGSILYTSTSPLRHKLLQHLGPEPLEDDFDGDHLFIRSRGRHQAVKHFIMDSRIVVGVGNIYASEALFKSGIHPRRAAGRISRQRYTLLAQAIRYVLEDSITQGGTTLRNFFSGEGSAGYYRQRLLVYGRNGESCTGCGRPVRKIAQGQRSTFYCSHCQH